MAFLDRVTDHTNEVLSGAADLILANLVKAVADQHNFFRKVRVARDRCKPDAGPTTGPRVQPVQHHSRCA
jgi:hypothetical protein